MIPTAGTTDQGNVRHPFSNRVSKFHTRGPIQARNVTLRLLGSKTVGGGGGARGSKPFRNLLKQANLGNASF
jgi:hypothetical protein